MLQVRGGRRGGRQLGAALLGGPPRPVGPGPAGRRPLPDGRLPGGGADSQRDALVSEEGGQLAALGPNAAATGLPRCRQSAGGAVRARGLDPTGRQHLLPVLSIKFWTREDDLDKSFRVH